MDVDDDAEDQHTPRTAAEIARRALVLNSVIVAAYGWDRDDLITWLKDEGLWDEATPKEKLFLSTPKPDAQQLINFSWRSEAQVALLWAIQTLPNLGSLAEEVDTVPLVDAIPGIFEPTREFIESASLREPDVIMREREKVRYAHWQVRDASLRKLPVPNGINPGIVQERHHGFNWVIGYCGDEWDDVTADT